MEYTLHPPHNEAQIEQRLSTSETRATILSLRIPADLLLRLSDNSRLMIVGNVADSDVGPSSVRKKRALTCNLRIVSHDVEKEGPAALEEYRVRTDSAPAIHVYRPREEAVASTGPSSNMHLHHVGSATTRCTVEARRHVAEIGKKARDRLAEERTKRSEIVRLADEPNQQRGDRDDDEKSPLARAVAKRGKKRVNSSFSESVRASGKTTTTAQRANNTTTRQPRVKVVTKRQRGTTAAPQKNDPNVDWWTPDTSHVRRSGSRKDGDLSNVVCVHGLPMGTKPEHLHKFFLGLDPERIFTLPTYKGHVEEMDASTAPRRPSMKKTGSCIVVERHCSNELRVFVKFQSVPIAQMAVQRSGELLVTTTNNHHHHGAKRGGGAAIIVTSVSKSVAFFVLKNMAIDGKRGEALLDTLQQVEETLPKMARKILWVMAGRELNFNVRIKTLSNSSGGEEQQIPSILVKDLDRIKKAPSNNNDSAEYHRQLALMYNALWDHHESLRIGMTPLMLYDFFPISTGKDAAHRLMCVVSNWFLEEMENIQSCLLLSTRGRKTDNRHTPSSS